MNTDKVIIALIICSILSLWFVISKHTIIYTTQGDHTLISHHIPLWDPFPRILAVYASSSHPINITFGTNQGIEEMYSIKDYGRFLMPQKGQTWTFSLKTPHNAITEARYFIVTTFYIAVSISFILVALLIRYRVSRQVKITL